MSRSAVEKFNSAWLLRKRQFRSLTGVEPSVSRPRVSRPMSSRRQIRLVMYHPDAFLPAELPFTFRQHETEPNPM